MATATMRSSRPRGIQEITAEAEDFSLNANIPLKVWLRTAQMLTQRGDMHLRKGEWSQAYMLYWRYAVLVTERLKKHPEFKTTAGRDAARPVLSQLPAVLDGLGRMKPLIQREYEQWEKEEARREALRTQQRAELAQALDADQHDAYTSPRRRHHQHDEHLDLETHRDLAVELAQDEMRRRERERQTQAGSRASGGQQRDRRVAGIWDQWTDRLADEQSHDEELFRAQMESTRSQLDDRNARDAYGTDPQQASQHTTSYNYPSIARSEPVKYEPTSFHQRVESAIAPSRPPKHDLVPPPLYQSDRGAPRPPPLPSKDLLYSQDYSQTLSANPQHAPALPPKDYPVPEPPVKTQKPFRPAAYLENGEPLRSIFLPGQLRHRFLDVAEPNTRQGLEMCGMLCGTDVNNALVVSCLIIPEQKCTSDTCETENENALLEYCMTEDLLMIGWIHTHPTQTCFMSSRDLHTHAGYQIMLPESIAIVCAPSKQPDHGIFRLTNPPGLPHILNCEQAATFHQHSIDNLYTSVERPQGHVLQDDRLGFTVVDLRPGFRDGPNARKNF
ncbi:Mov34/MPN/PAD-1 family protein [Microdochium bolleyi]|uniref:Mov34/MPN/PAD-1 family protein n=1 Tax=Microdochium bolleyi TaxID=196109 RepID=A0A136IZ17_9PEZI|nr:Mov34/MPN/PAD-1 family protein [Microdochium bolleyi]